MSSCVTSAWGAMQAPCGSPGTGVNSCRAGLLASRTRDSPLGPQVEAGGLLRLELGSVAGARGVFCVFSFFFLALRRHWRGSGAVERQ
jgi:hypothetical protein